MQKTGTLPVLVILDNVRSMHNVGSVFRTGDAFLVEGICLCGYTPRPPHRDIQKTALGATETVEWKYFDEAVSAIQYLRSEEYKIYGVEQVENSIPLQEFSKPQDFNLAIIFGNELSGIGQNILELCDGFIEKIGRASCR